jgi:hypothetical protein
MPFSLRAARVLRDDGDSAAGAAIELILLGWAVHAGTVRGSGDFGSYVSFAWRWANQAIQVFGPPVVNPFLVLRLPGVFRVQSELGLRRLRPDVRFTVRRQAINEFI